VLWQHVFQVVACVLSAVQRASHAARHSVDFMAFRTVEAYASLRLTRIKYNINNLPRAEKE